MEIAQKFEHAGYFYIRRISRSLFFSVAVTLVAFAIRRVFLMDILGASAPFLLFYFSVIAAAWYGGCAAGVLSTVLSTLLGIYFFMSPLDTFVESDIFGTAMFMATGVFISIVFQMLARAQALLQDADRRKDEFLATLAHELRNPLATICNAVEILQAPKDEEIRLSTLDALERQARQVTQLVDDLMDVTRITRGKIALRREPVLLSDIIQGAAESVQSLAGQKEQTLSCNLPREDVWLDGDATRLMQIFSNILHNAVKYTGAGGSISVDARAMENTVSVSISDNGIGIAPEMLPHIFEMFMQVDGTGEPAQKGIGIGLFLVRNLVRLHGGDLSAESTGPGRGSRFTVRLPRAMACPLPASHQVSAPEKPRSRRVLVVDDNADSAQTLAWMLEPLGYDVMTAGDGPSAIQAAKSFHPEIILLDIGLPGMDGHEVCRQLRRIPVLEGAIIVAQTGYGQASDRARSAAAGFDAHLVKPVTIKAVQQALHNARSHAPLQVAG